MPKVHLETSSGHNGTAPWQASKCGAAFRYDGHGNYVHNPAPIIVRRNVWVWLPRRAMCFLCLRALTKGAQGRGHFESRVTPEIELAVEVALAGLARVPAQWPDVVAEHGTEGNPHVWFARPDEGAVCPCGEAQFIGPIQEVELPF